MEGRPGVEPGSARLRGECCAELSQRPVVVSLVVSSAIASLALLREQPVKVQELVHVGVPGWILTSVSPPGAVRPPLDDPDMERLAEYDRANV
jgi:hypothetical protein